MAFERVAQVRLVTEPECRRQVRQRHLLLHAMPGLPDPDRGEELVRRDADFAGETAAQVVLALMYRIGKIVQPEARARLAGGGQQIMAAM